MRAVYQDDEGAFRHLLDIPLSDEFIRTMDWPQTREGFVQITKSVVDEIKEQWLSTDEWPNLINKWITLSTIYRDFDDDVKLVLQV